MTFNRRHFLKSIGTVTIGTALSTKTLQAEEKNNNQFDFESIPYLQNFTPTSISIFAIFTKPCLAWIEILNQDNSIKETLYQTEDGMRNANATIFKFTVSHENKNFKYRVVAKEILTFQAYKIEYGKTISSEIKQTNLPFPTSNDTTHLLILNDVHGISDTYSELYNQSTLPKKDLVLLNGDLFDYVTTQKDITHKLTNPIAEAFATQTPFVLVRGNHETRGAFARNVKKYFDYPNNKFYYSFTIGALFVIILDGGEDKPDSHSVYANTVDYDNYRFEQKAWLENVLKSKEKKKAKHCIIINHIPWLHSDDWHGTMHNKECFHELTQKYKVDAVISGHTHKYGFHKPNQEHNYYVAIGGGPKVGRRTYVEITANKKNLTVTMKKDDGSIIDTFTK